MKPYFKNRLYLFIAIYLLFCNFTSGQDRIYTAEGPFIDGEVSRLDKDVIEYKVLSGGTEITQTLSTYEVLLVFFPNGQYVTYPFDESGAFQFRSYPNLPYDLLITKYGETLKGKILSLENNRASIKVVGLNVETTLDFSELLIGIYANGKHAIFKDPRQSIQLLNYVGKSIRELALTKVESTDHTPVNAGRPSYIKSNTPVIETPPTPPVTLTIESEDAPLNPTPKEKNELTDVDFAEFSDKALQKIDDLGSFISIISNKQTFPDQANQAIDLAIYLFVNEDAVVEVSTIGYTASIKRKIRDYLNRLKLLKYDKVEIKWADLNYVSNFRKGPDGNYYGTVSIKQTFQGFMDNKIVYSDVTEKQVEIVLKGMDKSIDGKEELVWDVLLSDIGVLDTKN